MERHGASHTITQTLPGTTPDPQVRQTRLLKSAVTRTRNRVDALETEYGAHDVPQSSPHYPKIEGARRAHREALGAYRQHTGG
jgi:hypothetical protein